MIEWYILVQEGRTLNHDRSFLFLGPAPRRSGPAITSTRTIAPSLSIALPRLQPSPGAILMVPEWGRGSAVHCRLPACAGRPNRCGVSGDRSLNRDRMRRPLALFEEDVVS